MDSSSSSAVYYSVPVPNDDDTLTTRPLCAAYQMRPPSAPGPPVEEVVSRIERTSARISKPVALPPIAESAEKALPEPEAAQSSNQNELLKPSSKPLPSIPKQQDSFNKALENITR